MFDLADVAALKLISAVLLLQQLQVPFDLLPLLIVEFPFHPSECLLLRLLRDSTLEALTLDPLFEQLHLILVVGLDGVDHELVLDLLSLLVLLEFTLLLQKLVFLQLARQFVNFLAQHNLLGVALVV